MRKIFMAMAIIASTSMSYAAPDTKALQNIIGDIKIKAMNPSEIKGLHELYLEGVGMPLYISDDGNYLIEGQITDLVNKKNLTEAKMNTARKEMIAMIPEKDMIIYKQPDAKHVITVFTDVDCGYCRKMHSELAEYFKEGIAVRYLAFPSISKGNKMASVWCSKDPATTMTLAKKGQKVPEASCDTDPSPVKTQYELGLALGVTGTPNIILEDGTMLGGYIPAKELAKLLNK